MAVSEKEIVIHKEGIYNSLTKSSMITVITLKDISRENVSKHAMTS